MKILLVLLLNFTVGQAIACPSCMSDPETSKTYLIVIWSFIALIYIPFFLLFKTFIKHRNINKLNPESQNTDGTK